MDTLGTLWGILVGGVSSGGSLRGGRLRGGGGGWFPLSTPPIVTHTEVELSLQAADYWESLQSLVVRSDDPHMAVELVPELYIVPLEKVGSEVESATRLFRVPSSLLFSSGCLQIAEEKACHGVADRRAGGTTPYLWAQALFIICRLIWEGFLSPAELDPLSRRLSITEKRPPTEVQGSLRRANSVCSLDSTRDKILERSTRSQWQSWPSRRR